nr:uncharacterized protein LOC129525556 isoform X3 [Gorilla gorilla gorilla]
MAYLGPYPTSRQSPQMSLLPHNSLHRHSSIVTMASLDPAPASQPSLQALNFLRSPSVVQGWRVVVLSQLTAASTFQAEAILPSQRPTWLRLQVGPSSFRKTSLTRPLILHYAPTSRQPRQAQNSLQSASTDQAHDSQWPI